MPAMTTLNSPQADLALRTAFEMARQGQLQHAEALCSEVLQKEADHAEALLLRGIIEVQTGRNEEALESVRRSIQCDASRAAAHALLGDTLLNLRRPPEALESYDTALLLNPALSSAQYGRGNALLDMQRFREAALGYEQFLRSQPADAEALFNCGSAWLQLNELPKALDCFDRAIGVRPNYPGAHHNRGSVLMLLQRADDALASFDATLATAPGNSDALYNRACALRMLRRLPEALESLDRALQIQPSSPALLAARGEVLQELQRSEEALAAFDGALLVAPKHAAAMRGRGDSLLELGNPAAALAAHDAAFRLGAEPAAAHNSRGNSLSALRRTAEALQAYDESLRLDPANATVHRNRAGAAQAEPGHHAEVIGGYLRALELNPNIADAAGLLFYAQQSECDWSVRTPAASRENLLTAVLDGRAAMAPFAFLSLTDSASAQLRCAQHFVAQKGASQPAPRISRSRRRPRIRVAYVSADFREHAVSYLLAGVIERHDLERFETTAISLRSAEASPTGERMQRAFSRFIDVSGQSDGQVAALMRDLEIDIAVDLGGLTQGSRPRIWSERAAPIQVTYLGYPGTTGLTALDYLIADDFVIPSNLKPCYSEQIVYLPDCFQANDDRREISDRIVSREQQGLPEQEFVFCCLNNNHKLNPAIFDVWCRLLGRVPGSVLWLLGEDAAVRTNLQREAQSRGVDPRRLVFATRTPYAEHLGRLRLADLFLDTLPFNAGATASDALWAGVPVLSCAGEAYAARMSGSLLRAVGLPELITDSVEQYEARATELALTPRHLSALRERLQENRARQPLFDTDRFRRHLEAAYTTMWTRQDRGERPQGFAVESLAG
jgi:protein O-GlcNAc transferase